MLAVSIAYTAQVFAFIPVWEAIIASVLFVFNLIPGFQEGIVWASWTIGVEMPFYLLFPFLYRWFNNAQKAGVFFIFAVLGAAIANFILSLVAPENNVFMKGSIIRHLPIFACGLLAFHVCSNALANRPPSREIGALSVGVAFLLLAATLQGSLPGIIEGYYWQAIMFFALLIGLAIYPTAGIVNRVTAFLGKLSYSLYLIHPILIHSLSPAYQKIYGWQAPLSVKWSASVTLTLGLPVPIAYASYRLVEKPGMRLGARLVARIDEDRRYPRTPKAA